LLLPLRHYCHSSLYYFTTLTPLATIATSLRTPRRFKSLWWLKFSLDIINQAKQRFENLQIYKIA
ncbi:MAG: hypothetical protein IKK93_06315, partial [Campylobacter sp.]|nr:hypothetical protein [Campylobacter sp.]